MQEAMLRVWRGLAGFDGRSSLRSWLYRIATNVCLDTLGRRKRRVLPAEYAPPARPARPARPPGELVADHLWLEPYPDEILEVPDGYASPEASYEEREALELAFVAAMQHLPARQRAVLILREVVEDYMEAMHRGDVNRVVSMLAEDAAWSMPPLASWYTGTAALEAFLRNGPLCGRWDWRHRAAHANGQLAVGTYTWIEGEGAHIPFSLDVLTLDGEKIHEITAFIVRTTDVPDGYSRWPDHAADAIKVQSVFERFGLPARLD